MLGLAPLHKTVNKHRSSVLQLCTDNPSTQPRTPLREWFKKSAVLTMWHALPSNHSQHTEITCWSGSHWDYRDQTARTLWARMPLLSPPQDVLQRTRTVQVLGLEMCFSVYLCKQSWPLGRYCGAKATLFCACQLLGDADESNQFRISTMPKLLKTPPCTFGQRTSLSARKGTFFPVLIHRFIQAILQLVYPVDFYIMIWHDCKSWNCITDKLLQIIQANVNRSTRKTI